MGFKQFYQDGSLDMRFRIGDLEVSFSFWFFSVIALLAALEDGALSPYFALPVIIHELGHIAAMKACGVKIKSVAFQAFSIDIEKSGNLTGYGKEITICAAGALANAIFAAGLYFFAFKSMRVMFLTASNLAVAIFNLLPIGTLDGGSILRLLSGRFFSPEFGSVISRLFSFAVLVPLFGASILLLLRPERNFTLLIVCAYLTLDIIVNG